MIVHECPNGQYLARVRVTKDQLEVRSAKKASLVAIVDRSGSMGNNVKRIMHGLLPGLMEKLEFKTITVITFDSKEATECYEEVTAAKLKSMSDWQSRGQTYFADALKVLARTLDKLGSDCIYLLTVSDGIMNDIENVVRTAEELAPTIMRPGRIITSYAIRYNTGGCPDTRGLSSVLQFNTNAPCKIVDMEVIPDVEEARRVGAVYCADLFADAPQHTCIAELSAPEGLLLPTPWEPPVASLSLAAGEHVIWLTRRPVPGTDTCALGGRPLEIAFGERMDIDNAEHILGNKLQYWLDRIRVLQVLGSSSSAQLVGSIGTYFSALQSALTSQAAIAEAKAASDTSLRGKLTAFLRQKRREARSMLMTISRVANETAVERLNAQQAADYLRGTSLSTAAKGLARRAGMAGGEALDVDALVRREVRNIISNLHELDEVPPATEIVSFCSLESTQSALLALRELTEEDIEALSATELLRFVHIVGIACRGNIGDYPDAMSWRCEEFFPGTYVSIADITEHYTISRTELKAPGFDKPITTVLPVFEDARVHAFLLRHAPNILDLQAGIGMRRMLARVHVTHLYTLCAGVFNGICALADGVKDMSATQAVANSVAQLLPNYATAVGSYFNHVLPLMERPPQRFTESFPEVPGASLNRSFYLLNNGVTNMIFVLFHCFKNNLPVDEGAVLRALYSYETYQSIKKFRSYAMDTASQEKDQRPAGAAAAPPPAASTTSGAASTAATSSNFEEWDNIAAEFLQLTPDLVDVGAILTADPPAPGYDAIEPEALPIGAGNKFYAKLASRLDRFAFLGPMASILKTVAQTLDGKLDRASIPDASPETLLKALELEGQMTLEQFKFFNILQAMVYHSQQLRMDKDKGVMNMPDLDCMAAGLLTVRQERTKYIKRIYAEKIKGKREAEAQHLSERLVNALLDAPTVSEFARLLREGITHSEACSFRITGPDSRRVPDLRAGLCNAERNVPDRMMKIATLLLGKEMNMDLLCTPEAQGVNAWNNGNAWRTDIRDFASIALRTDEKELWEAIQARFRSGVLHVYREAPEENRHQHGNHAPSYWALGFSSLSDMEAKVSAEEFGVYLAAHSAKGCCGTVPRTMSYRQMKRAQRREENPGRTNFKKGPRR